MRKQALFLAKESGHLTITLEDDMDLFDHERVFAVDSSGTCTIVPVRENAAAWFVQEIGPDIRANCKPVELIEHRLGAQNYLHLAHTIAWNWGAPHANPLQHDHQKYPAAVFLRDWGGYQATGILGHLTHGVLDEDGCAVIAPIARPIKENTPQL